MSEDGKTCILMVCRGNICRSPIAEGVLVDLVKKRGLEQKYLVDSCATGPNHIGEKADPRALNTMKPHHILIDHQGRLLDKEDFARFKYIFGMDHANIEAVNAEKPSGSTATIGLLGEYDPEGQVIIRDSYRNDGEQGFETCYEQCVRACTAFLDKLESQ
ncbi:low molecular weight protein-tyrosine-phosphatase [Aphelenchoides avenae]|nr:low molecular weight protein-tyrosine-phosphatase [Aphelenchus avenae]